MSKRKRSTAVPETPRSREELEAQHERVWDTRQLAEEFVITSIIGHTVVVRRKTDDLVGTLQYQEAPRLYFGFRPQANS
jgi:hypothetical protein